MEHPVLVTSTWNSAHVVPIISCNKQRFETTQSLHSHYVQISRSSNWAAMVQQHIMWAEMFNSIDFHNPDMLKYTFQIGSSPDTWYNLSKTVIEADRNPRKRNLSSDVHQHLRRSDAASLCKEPNISELSALQKQPSKTSSLSDLRKYIASSMYCLSIHRISWDFTSFLTDQVQNLVMDVAGRTSLISFSLNISQRYDPKIGTQFVFMLRSVRPGSSWRQLSSTLE